MPATNVDPNVQSTSGTDQVKANQIGEGKSKTKTKIVKILNYTFINNSARISEFS